MRMNMPQQIFPGIRKRSARKLCGLPLVDIALGPDPGKGELRGHAHGIIAIGGGAVGYYAFSGGAIGEYVVSAMQRSPEAVEFFKHWLPFLPIRW